MAVQLRLGDKLQHLQNYTLEEQSLALKRNHEVYKYFNTAAINMFLTLIG